MRRRSRGRKKKTIRIIHRWVTRIWMKIGTNKTMELKIKTTNMNT